MSRQDAKGAKIFDFFTWRSWRLAHKRLLLRLDLERGQLRLTSDFTQFGGVPVVPSGHFFLASVTVQL